MDIRFINRRSEIINCSELSIKVMRKYLVGMDERKSIVEIEEYENEEKAKKVLETVANIVREEMTGDKRGIVIDLREREKRNNEDIV